MHHDADSLFEVANRMKDSELQRFSAMVLKALEQRQAVRAKKERNGLDTTVRKTTEKSPSAPQSSVTTTTRKAA
jgi:hypothetical protein